MEVIVLRGAIREIRRLSDALLSLKGVKHGKLFVTMPAQEIIGRKAAANGHAHQHKH
jgi:CopG family nickel-responsive transcriptional regulator